MSAQRARRTSELGDAGLLDWLGDGWGVETVYISSPSGSYFFSILPTLLVVPPAFLCVMVLRKVDSTASNACNHHLQSPMSSFII